MLNDLLQEFFLSHVLISPLCYIRPFDTILIVKQRKDGFIINRSLDLTYTPEMEKAMQQNHGMSYAEYGRKLNNQLKVEKKREQSYQKSQQVVNEFERLAHR